MADVEEMAREALSESEQPPREVLPLTKETVAIPKSQGRVKWQVPVMAADVELLRDEVLESVVQDLAERYPNLKHLSGLTIRVYWQKAGRTRNGAPNMGGIKKPSPWYEVGSGAGADYLLWLAADHIADQQYTGFQLEAFLFHQLCSLQQNEEGEVKVQAPDFVGYLPEIEAYGLWRVPLKEAGERFRQPSLFE